MKVNYLIYGFGMSGEWAFRLILKKKCYDKIFVYDEKEEGIDKAVKLSKGVKNVFVLEKISDDIVKQINKVILSPGVSIFDKWVKVFKSKGVEVNSELEFAYNFFRKKLVAITGTNGKTTTVKMLNNVLNCANKKSVAVGNVGYPFSRAIIENKRAKIFVCEVSSFQLEAIKNFKPSVACVLNVTEDHLNRHGSFLNYKRTKLNIAKNLGKKEFFVCKKGLYNLKKRDFDVFCFGRDNLGFGAFFKNGLIWFRSRKGEEVVIGQDEIGLMGEHNLENVMAVVTIAKLLGIKTKHIIEGIKNFKPDRHRLEKVFEKDGVAFIDDSKATNVDATVRALECFDDRGLILLVGGSDKGFSFDEIFKNIKENVKFVLCFGGVREKLEESARKFGIQVKIFEKLIDATNFACSIADNGDVVLLSPANASFDEFKDYKDRGDKFLKYVLEYFEEEK